VATSRSGLLAFLTVRRWGSAHAPPADDQQREQEHHHADHAVVVPGTVLPKWPAA
jgi:hypothetical protein